MRKYRRASHLCHHGIKGQKWGIRRFQNKDGSLTPQGRRRYDDGDSKRSIKQKRYDTYYQKYKTLGKSDQEAAKLAKGRVAAERSLVIVGSVALAAASAYGAYRYADYAKDRTISPNKIMQTVHKGDISERIKPGNPFFASYTKRDNTIYASKVFSHFTDDSNITHFYTKDGIKAASERTGRKVFDDLIKNDPEVAEYAKRIGYFGDSIKSYRRFNYSLVLRNNSPTAVKMGLADLDHDKIHNKFYDALKKRGFGAVIDVNDSKHEGFTFNPVIVFDNQIKHVISTTKATSEQLGAKRTMKGLAWAKLRKTTIKPWSNPTLVQAGIGFATAAGISASSQVTQAVQTNARVRFVEQYRREHPSTRLTNAEIAKMYNT